MFLIPRANKQKKEEGLREQGHHISPPLNGPPRREISPARHEYQAATHPVRLFRFGRYRTAAGRPSGGTCYFRRYCFRGVTAVFEVDVAASKSSRCTLLPRRQPGALGAASRRVRQAFFAMFYSCCNARRRCVRVPDPKSAHFASLFFIPVSPPEFCFHPPPPSRGFRFILFPSESYFLFFLPIERQEPRRGRSPCRRPSQSAVRI